MNELLWQDTMDAWLADGPNQALATQTMLDVRAAQQRGRFSCKVTCSPTQLEGLTQYLGSCQLRTEPETNSQLRIMWGRHT